MRQVKANETLLEFTGSLALFVAQLDLLWYGYQRRRPSQKDLWWDTQEAVDECDRLLNNLRSLAPEGYSFEPHPDQPTCWGFWKIDGSYGEKTVWTQVKSSNIKEMALQGTIMKVRFHNGAEYHYEGVPVEIFKTVVAAESVGRAFNEHIQKGEFPYERI